MQWHTACAVVDQMAERLVPTRICDVRKQAVTLATRRDDSCSHVSLKACFEHFMLPGPTLPEKSHSSSGEHAIQITAARRDDSG